MYQILIYEYLEFLCELPASTSYHQGARVQSKFFKVVHQITVSHRWPGIGCDRLLQKGFRLSDESLLIIVTGDYRRCEAVEE
jgi:hypothetical protein